MEKSNKSGLPLKAYRSRNTHLLGIAAVALLSLAAITATVLKKIHHPIKVIETSTITTLATFNGANGATPNSGMVLIGHTLYGTTMFGGVKYKPNSTALGDGIVFSVPIKGGAPTDIARFSSGKNGRCPAGNLTLSGKTLYGTTYNGGPRDIGTIFSVPTKGGTPTELASINCTNGSAQHGSLVLIGKTLYGTIECGGSYGRLSVYSVPTTGGTLTFLASFNGTNGGDTSARLILSGTTLYGTSLSAGLNDFGTVFSIPITGGTPNILATFNGTKGKWPVGSLILKGNTLYGTTGGGGITSMPNGGEFNEGYGTVFSVPKTGGTPTILSSFNGTDGYAPNGSLVLGGSTLYGTTVGGGTYHKGTVFSVPINGGTPTILACFNGTNGAEPCGSLVLSGSTLYGTTAGGGPYDQGTVFSIPITGATPKPSPSASDPTPQK